jgi:hypothetical protein
VIGTADNERIQTSPSPPGALVRGRDRNGNLLAGQRHRYRYRHHALGLPGIADRAFDLAAIAAEHMHRSIDDDLRRVDVAIAAHLRIGFLTRAEARIRQGVLPAEIIPVIDRHAQRDDGWISGQLTDDLVCGRTRRTSLRREQFNHRARIGMRRTDDGKNRADAKRT